jgi:uncharacterized membrane protein
MVRREHRTERGLERIVFFSDAVAAIAITLLILPVVDAASPGRTLSQILHHDGSRIFAFALSFVVIAQYWVMHHRVFEWIDGYDNVLIWCNMLWLATIVFLPFPTELLGVHGYADTGIRFLYLATITAGSAALALLELVVHRRPEIRTGDGPAEFSLLPGLLTLGLLIVATIVATAVPAIGLWALLLLLASNPIGKWIERRTGG